MKKLILATAVAALVSVPAGMTAQSPASSNPDHRVLGYQDSATGKFQPLVKAEPDTTTPTSTGTIKLSIYILIRSAVPSTANVICGASVGTSSVDLTAGTVSGEYEEEAFSPATVSGTTANCTVTIPYAWTIPAASSTVKDTITGSYTVEVINTDGTTTFSVFRLTGGNFLSLTAVPATGTTTSVNKSVIL